MFEIKQISSYEEFEHEVKNIFSEIENSMNGYLWKLVKKYGISESDIAKIARKPYPPLFRGQRNGSWKLKSTLERTCRYLKSSEIPYLNYLQIMRNVQGDIQRETGKKWNLNQTFDDCPSQISPYPEEYEFMAYLRHHRFPSPLLDWTVKMKVASFFAFENPSDEENVAVYLYLEYIGRGDAGWTGRANLETPFPDIKPDIRHEKQGSRYMLSIATIEGEKIICNIEEAIKNKIYIDKKLKKFLIPSREREKVLLKLEGKGINARSLFQDDDENSLKEDSLIERLKKREFPLDEL